MPGRVTLENLDDVFTYHPPNDQNTIDKYRLIREKAKELASLIIQLCPECADTSAAVRHIREGVMTANAAIALNGLV